MDTDFESLSKSKLEEAAEAAGLTVTRSDGEEGDPLKDDFVAALKRHHGIFDPGDKVLATIDNDLHDARIIEPVPGYVVEMNDHAGTRAWVPKTAVQAS